MEKKFGEREKFAFSHFVRVIADGPRVQYTTMLLCIAARQCWKPLMLFMRHFVCECGGGGDHFFCPPSFPFRYVTTFVTGRLQLKLAGVSILLLETLYPKESQGKKEDTQA